MAQMAQMMKSHFDHKRAQWALVKAGVSADELARRTGQRASKIRAQLAGKAPIEEVVSYAIKEIEREAGAKGPEG